MIDEFKQKAQNKKVYFLQGKENTSKYRIAGDEMKIATKNTNSKEISRKCEKKRVCVCVWCNSAGVDITQM